MTRERVSKASAPSASRDSDLKSSRTRSSTRTSVPTTYAAFVSGRLTARENAALNRNDGSHYCGYMAIRPTQDQITRLVSAGPDGAIVMVNLLKYRTAAAYESNRAEAKENLTGRDAYLRYGVHVQQILRYTEHRYSNSLQIRSRFRDVGAGGSNPLSPTTSMRKRPPTDEMAGLAFQHVPFCVRNCPKKLVRLKSPSGFAESHLGP